MAFKDGMVVVKGRIQDSMNARAVARDVVDTTRRGEKVIMSKIVRRHGYSESTASTGVASVRNTQAYKDEIESYTKRLEKHRTKVLIAMEKKNLDEEQYRTLSEAQTKLTHDVQLLTGGSTENVGVQEDHNVLINILAEIRGETPKIHDGRAKIEGKSASETL